MINLKRYILDAVVAVFELQEAMCNYIFNSDSSVANKKESYILTYPQTFTYENK